MHKSRIVIPCAKGIPPFLKEEVLSLGFPVLAETVSGIETEGTMDDTMKLNLMIRTGQRVLFLLKEFDAKHPDDLYDKVSTIRWEDCLSEEGYLSVTSSVDTPTIKDSRFANLRCKDAIVDRIQKRHGRRPDSGPEKNGVVVHLFWHGKQCRVFLDTSGETLSRRGYRRIPLKAPMQETLAAATILATHWKTHGNFVNPMCGSGTLAIEAALIALDRAPCLLRDHYGFMHLKGFNASEWRALRRASKGRAKKIFNGKIIATDIRPEAVEATRKNAATAGVEHLIKCGLSSYAETPLPEGGGVILLNPPYGERLGEIQKLEEIYQGIGDFFKKRGQGYTGYIFTGNLNLAKKVGLRTKRRTPFFNGEIECRLLEFDLYEGSRKGQPNLRDQKFF